MSEESADVDARTRRMIVLNMAGVVGCACFTLLLVLWGSGYAFGGLNYERFSVDELVRSSRGSVAPLRTGGPQQQELCLPDQYNMSTDVGWPF